MLRHLEVVGNKEKHLDQKKKLSSSVVLMSEEGCPQEYADWLPFQGRSESPLLSPWGLPLCPGSSIPQNCSWAL